MFQVYVPNVSSVFSDVCLQVFHQDVAYIFVSVSDVCSKCFSCFRIYVASVSSGYFKSRFGVTTSVSYAYFNCFIYLQAYVTSVASRCSKSRLDVCISLLAFFCLASVSFPPPASTRHPPRALPLFLDAGDAQADVGPVWVLKRRKNDYMRKRPDV
jgi:hypothetical protein